MDRTGKGVGAADEAVGAEQSLLREGAGCEATGAGRGNEPDENDYEPKAHKRGQAKTGNQCPLGHRRRWGPKWRGTQGGKHLNVSARECMKHFLSYDKSSAPL
jgi:hypothetical protein